MVKKNMKLITKKLEKLFEKYPPRTQSETEDPICIAKYFNPYGYGTWYVLEAEKYEDTYIFYGWVESPLGVEEFNEFGTFALNELESIKIPLKVNGQTIGYGGIERDIHFKPTKLSEIQGGL